MDEQLCDVCGRNISDCKKRRDGLLVEQRSDDHWQLRGDDIDIEVCVLCDDDPIRIEVDGRWNDLTVAQAVLVVDMLQRAIEAKRQQAQGDE